MAYVVSKPFKTVSRKFAPGEGPGGSLDGTEDLSPHTFDTLQSRGFIKAKSVATAAMVDVPAAQSKAAATRAASSLVSTE